MWAEYNYTSYPVVEVNMKGVIESDEEFEDFLDGWTKLYEKKRDFVFIFDTRQVGWVSPRYAFRMASFISKLKRNNKQYLKQSSIIVNSIWVKTLLRLIFAIQSPVCPIVYHSSEKTINIEDHLNIANKFHDPDLGLIFGIDRKFRE